MSAYITQRIRAAWAHMKQGRAADAEDVLRLVLKAQPDHAEANGMMAALYLQKARGPEALAHATRAVRSDPRSVPARETLIAVLNASGDREGALAQIEALAGLGPLSPGMAATHAGTLRDLLRYEEALAVYRSALAAHPRDPLLTTMLAFSLNYTPGVSAEEVASAHRAFGETIDAAHPPRARRFANDPDPERPLRVAFMSADLHTHSVSYFLEPLLRHADPARLRPHLYQSAAPAADETTARLRSLAAGFRGVVGRTPAQIAEAAVADGIDALIELNGLTSTTQPLAAMNHAPAPLTGTYIGYPHSTGLRSIGLRFVDSITDPPGADAHSTESLVRLDPCFLCYGPPAGAPPVNPEPPSVRAGHVTFGSFNNAQKLNSMVIAAWARIVTSVPGARLLLKHFRFREPALRKEVLGGFARAGLGAERIELLPKEDGLAQHLGLYERIDVALDPFPYNGTTTICEATLQGVPTVTLRGDRHAGRVGASLLTAIGVPELIAADARAYVAAAAALGSDRAGLAAYRATLRTRLLASPLCDGPGHSARFEAALRSRWRDWCAAGRA